MEMDYEDRLFIREVGARAARVLKTRNIRLWNEFKQRCEENSEKPESVLGKYLYKFAKSLVEEDGEFAEELLETTIKMSALAKRKELLESLDEIVEVKKKLESAESSTIDKLIERLIETEIAKTAISPIDMIKADVAKQEHRIVIDENLLASLPPEQLELMEQLIRKVKEEKTKAKQLSADEIEKLLSKMEEVENEEEEEGTGYSEDSEDSYGSSEGVEELGEGAGRADIDSEADEESGI